MNGRIVAAARLPPKCLESPLPAFHARRWRFEDSLSACHARRRRREGRLSACHVQRCRLEGSPPRPTRASESSPAHCALRLAHCALWLVFALTPEPTKDGSSGIDRMDLGDTKNV